MSFLQRPVLVLIGIGTSSAAAAAPLQPMRSLHPSISRTQLTPRRNLKATTGITGVAVHQNPLPALTKVYGQTLTALSALPATSVYRQATEALTKHRLAVVEKANGDIPAVEKELGTIVEVALQEAESELALSGQVAEWKV